MPALWGYSPDPLTPTRFSASRPWDHYAESFTFTVRSSDDVLGALFCFYCSWTLESLAKLLHSIRYPTSVFTGLTCQPDAYMYVYVVALVTLAASGLVVSRDLEFDFWSDNTIKW